MGDCETHFMDQTTNQLPRVHARVCLRVHSVLRCTLRRESEIARRGGGSNVHGSVCARSDQSVDSAVSGWKSRARASNQNLLCGGSSRVGARERSRLHCPTTEGTLSAAR